MRWLAIILCLACSAAAAERAAVSRILRSIDFEERTLGNPEELPMHWSKVQGPGMPHYVNGRFSSEEARSGRYSFQFELNGGSVAYRYDTSAIRVRPQSHYRVEAHARTTVLPHARARLTAQLLDVDGRPIPGSARHSELYAAKQPGEPWRPLSVELSTGQASGTLCVDLELLQPAEYDQGRLGEQTLFPQDIRGSAWFDDVVISQVPRVTMRTDRPGNIFRRGETLAMQVLVSDRSTDDLAAQLVIRDAAGRIVFQRSGALDMAAAEALGASLKRMKLVLPALPPGWYEARLVMTSRGQFVGQEELHLVQLADANPFTAPDDRFGIIATGLPFEAWRELPEILPYLAAGRVKLAVWSRQGDVQQADSAGFDQLLVRLGELGITPTACLVDLPPQISKRLRSDSWLSILEARDEDWKPQLAYLVSRHANHLDRWQLGGDGTDAFVTQKEMRQVYARLYGEFTRLVQKPDLAMPWPAWYEMEGELPATVALSVHPSVLPDQLLLYMQDIRRHQGHNLSLSLQLLDGARYGRDVQIRDLAQRVIYALAADAQRIDIPLPFTVVREPEGLVKQPSEMLMIVRTLTTTLGEAQFRGRVPVGENVEAFLFDRNGQGIMAIWDRAGSEAPRTLSLILGGAPRAIDLWGNVTPLPRAIADGKPDQSVRVTVGATPIFLVDIDAQLAQLRSSLAFDRPLIESSFQAHTRRIRFANPYRTAISGLLRLKAPAGWTITPPALPFSVNPGEAFARDVVIEFPYNSFAGAKVVEATFELQDGQETRTTVPLTLNLGLSDVGMQTLALRDGKDVLVQQIITNYGDKPIDYTAFAIYPGYARQERLVMALGAGRSTIKLYRFANTPAAGARIRMGVRELQGTRILNDEIEIQ